MAYLNSDDGYPEHRKVWPLSDAAYRLHNSAMHYCAREATDGGIVLSKIRSLVPRFRAAALAELIERGLIHAPGEACGTKDCRHLGPDDYVVHDFLQWNKDRAWWEEKRRKDAERIAKWRAQHGE